MYGNAGAAIIGVDTNPQIIKLIENRKPPFAEPMVRELLSNRNPKPSFTLTRDTKEAVAESRIILIMVPTRIDERKNPDYSALEKSSLSIGRALQRGSLILVQSTVGPGITESIVKENLEKASGLKTNEDFGLAYSPIRASPGRILSDLENYPRIVAALDESTLERSCALVSIILKGGLIKMKSVRAAEATKLFENMFRDVNIALANELANYCEHAGLDYYEIAEAANSQPFSQLLRPGIVGGKCIPVNPYFLITEAKDIDVDLPLVKTARRVNDESPKRAVRTIITTLRECGKTLRGARILILGASYKANVKEEDALTPAHALYDSLRSRGARPTVWDPLFETSELKDLGYAVPPSMEDALEQSDCIVVAVAHEEFRRLKPRMMRTSARRGRIAMVDISGQGIFSFEDSTESCVCTSVGLGHV